MAERSIGEPRRTSTAEPAAPVLAVREIECQRGERLLFAPATFAVVEGAIVWIRGANGQGKTTLLRTLAGLAAPSAGSIAWRDARRPLYLAHANALKDDLTVAESLRFLLHLGGGRVETGAVDVALERLGLASRKDAFVRTLSQGQRRRVALARLAAQHEPSPWLLDEPFDALDASGVAVLAEIVVEHARRGGSVVLTSHLPLPIDNPAPLIVQLHEPAFA